MEDWKQRFTTLGFRPTEFGGMKGRFEDIDVVAVEHPFEGLCLMGSHVDGRCASEFETFIPVDTDFQGIAKAMIRIYELVHPKKIETPQPQVPPVPQRPRPSKEEAFRQVPGLLRELFRVADEFEFLFSRPFTPDGHMVGSIGEVVAAFVYDLELHCGVSECHDGIARDGRKVQVKLTGGNRSVGIYGEPEHLIVLQLAGRVEFVEVYNGPGALAWEHAGKLQKNGQRPISLHRLWGLQASVQPEHRLPQIRPLDSFTGVRLEVE